MDELIKEQLAMFEKIIKRSLTEDEVYLVRNSFQNGVGLGKAECKKAMTNMIEKMN